MDTSETRDNAVAESFFATLKRERVHRRDYETRAEAIADIFQYIEIFYNRQRRPWIQLVSATGSSWLLLSGGS